MIQNILTKSVFFIISVIIIYYLIKTSHNEEENFNMAPSSAPGINNCSLGQSPYDLSTIGEELVKLYWELLKRQPSSDELSSDIYKIKNGALTLEGVRRRLVDSDEYLRYTKLQSNELNPELTKMLSDRELITYISNIYNEEKSTIIPTTMELPLRDIYNYLNYNDYAFRAMLRDNKYPLFEQQVLTGLNLTKTDVTNIFLKYFTVKDLITAGTIIFGSTNTACSIDGVNSDLSLGYISSLNNNPSLFDKDKAARYGLGGNGKVQPFADDMPYSMTQTTASVELIKELTDITKTPDGKKKIPIHKHDMVLIPELAWSVPQEFPPVCTTLGQPSLAQPVFTNSSLLNGTPLGDAANTQVGSMMPKYDQVTPTKLKEYITIPN
jgi:hypothetical protein